MKTPNEQANEEKVIHGMQEAESRGFLIVKLSARRYAVGKRICNVGRLTITDAGQNHDLINWQSVELITRPMSHAEALRALRRAHDGLGIGDPTPDESLRLWAERYGVSFQDAQTLAALFRKRMELGTRQCNGDPYPGVPAADKEACADAWGADLDASDAKLEALAGLYGFACDYGSGMKGCLMRGQETQIIVPTD